MTAELVSRENDDPLAQVEQATRAWARAMSAAEQAEVPLISLLPVVLGVLREEGVIVPPDFLARMAG